MLKKINALLEIGCEEIPARFMPGFLADLKQKAEEKLKQERISFSKIQTLGTYRRLTLYIENIAPRQEDLVAEVKGPPAEIAYDKSGQPTQAAIGFAKSQKVAADALLVKKVGPKDYVFAKIMQQGKATAAVLASLFPEIISSLYQPLTMRWGTLDFKFIRPIHWLLALCGNKVVKFELARIKSSDQTRGHRYLKPKNKKAGKLRADLNQYKKKLLSYSVIVDQQERKELIAQQVKTAAKKAKASALIEEDLLTEVTFLVEYPIAYIGSLNSDFLKIPQDVLITSMKKNQKYFPVVNNSGKLQAKFVVVTDGCKNPQVVAGNQKVLSARLADAKFFFEEDKKLPLRVRLADLERVGFFKKLGMMSDKVARVIKLSAWLSKRLGLTEGEIVVASKIAELSKADLTTKMVYEFPELQGIMGKEYALLAGESAAVAQGIYEHYLPRYAGDELPSSMTGTVVALADRIDSLVGCFSIGAIPTGSVDPYGLRRAVNGIMRIILEKKIDLLLDEMIVHACKLYEPIFRKQQQQACHDFPKVKSLILNFIAGRLKPYLLEQGLRYDLVDAVLANFNDILEAAAIAQVLNKTRSEKWFKGVVMSADRVARIAKGAPRTEIREADLVDPAEKALFDLYMKVNWEVGEAENKENWEVAVKSLAKLTEAIELFFDKVLVMHKEERLKLNRLALLKSLDMLYLRVADFSKIVI